MQNVRIGAESTILSNTPILLSTGWCDFYWPSQNAREEQNKRGGLVYTSSDVELGQPSLYRTSIIMGVVVLYESRAFPTLLSYEGFRSFWSHMIDRAERVSTT